MEDIITYSAKQIHPMRDIEALRAEMREHEFNRNRFFQIIDGIKSGQVGPDDLDVLFELGELGEKLELDPADYLGEQALEAVNA